MTTTAEPQVVVQSAAAPTVTAVDRERFARELAASEIGPAVVLETCHRVEVHAATPFDVPLPSGVRTIAGADAVRHLMRLAVGLESTVVGEDQILHQLRTAFATATDAGALPNTMERLFQAALRTGRRARAWRDATPRSLADVAVEAIADHLGGPLTGRRVLVVGAGRMGRLAAAAARRAGAEVTVASRSLARAQHVAGAVGGLATALSVPEAARDDLAGVIVALGGPWEPHPGLVDRLARGDSPVVDLSQPPAIPAALTDALGARLQTVDSLTQRPRDPADERLTARLEQAAESATAEYLAWHDRRTAADAARSLAAHAERERTDALRQLWRQLPDLDATERDRIEGMSRRLAARLLREPLERLGDDRDGTHERAARRLFGL